MNHGLHGRDILLFFIHTKKKPILNPKHFLRNLAQDEIIILLNAIMACTQKLNTTILIFCAWQQLAMFCQKYM